METIKPTALATRLGGDCECLLELPAREHADEKGWSVGAAETPRNRLLNAELTGHPLTDS
jgi:hypothetical protein